MTQEPLIPAGVDDILATAGRRPRRPRTPKPAHPYAHLATKHPDGIRATWCHDCKAPILTGLDELACALQARVDHTPLTPLGEALARIAGQQTYEIRAGKPPRIVRRNATTITSRPAGATGKPHYDVVTTHTCTPTVPDAATTTSRIPAPPDAAFDPTLPPPF